MMDPLTVVQCPFCLHPRLVRAADLLAAPDAVLFRSCDVTCYTAHVSGLRERLRWDISWMRGYAL